MIFISFPFMLAALVPVICIEALIFSRKLAISYKKALYINALSNSASTFLGFPLAWGLLFLMELITTGFSCGPGFSTVSSSIITVIVEAAWLCPHENHLYWLIPAALIISLCVALFVSIVVEYLAVISMFKELDRPAVRRAIIVCNMISYTLLIMVCIFQLFREVAARQ